jgi:hypothetical protein
MASPPLLSTQGTARFQVVRKVFFLVFDAPDTQVTDLCARSVKYEEKRLAKDKQTLCLTFASLISPVKYLRLGPVRVGRKPPFPPALLANKGLVKQFFC